MFEVSVEDTFAAGHALRGYRGKCENPHGHNYKVRVTLAGETLDAIGLLYDFKDLKLVMNEVIDRLDHQFLNDIDPFRQQNPSAENMARYFYEVGDAMRQSGQTLQVKALEMYWRSTLLSQLAVMMARQ